MSRLTAVQVREAADTLLADEALLLPIPVGFPAAVRAELLDNVAALAQAVRGLGVDDVKVLRLSGVEIDMPHVEAVFVVYSGDEPEMPWRADR